MQDNFKIIEFKKYDSSGYLTVPLTYLETIIFRLKCFGYSDIKVI